MSTLSELALEAIKSLGGRAPVQRIADHVHDAMDPEDYRDLTWNGFVSQVRTALRAVGANGLPSAVAVGGDYVQVPLLDVEEYRLVIAGYVNRASANLALAQRFSDECSEVHGVTIAVEMPDASTA